ncbi:MAG: 3-methyladenine DNA glycosylase [Chloroflexi bacterium HGW-Chloroflexi-4]|jgi:DNA-3-methyladenine glycosylase|nr:MAG: 3-methyladenine DNA glycosylase [Chloroflexi bacterium HGW-Chloroflexi-4]
MTCLPKSFYHDEVTLVARRLLGMRLIRKLEGVRTGGIIVETEAYRGEEDLACHARVGKTKRNAMLYEDGGKAYVYFTYGMHWLVNAVTGEVGFPAAVLIRAILPLEGLDGIQARRNNRPQSEWCDGPAKICQALAIDGKLSGSLLYQENGELWIEEGEPVADNLVKTSPRIGLGATPDPWKSLPWRFFVDSQYIVNT